MNDLAPLPELRSVALSDKYTLTGASVYMTGTQALVRLLMLQRERDHRAGLNTAGFVSGYRGSPLGGLDQALWSARRYLDSHQVRFNPGLNEDLAATTIWGAQQVSMYPGAAVDGVFGMWYGKGPGVDRSMDAIKHANAAGTSKHGGVLALCGDDHAAKSSSYPHQSDHVLQAAGIPVFFPSNVQEILDYGIHAWALSRYAGVWAGMKCISDVIESGASVVADPERVQVRIPADFALPADGVHIRWPDAPLKQEERLVDHKMYATLAYIRENQLNRNVTNPTTPRLGVMSSGKAWLDTLQALADLGLSMSDCEAQGIRLHKVAVVWPLEPSSAREFATGLQEILVVEEKRQVMEYALKEQLYSWHDDVRPRIIGKYADEYATPRSAAVLPVRGELSPSLVAIALADRLLALGLPDAARDKLLERVNKIRALAQKKCAATALEARLPYYCSGCPHNTSTHVPEGSRAMAGIGCHSMAMWMPERRTGAFTHMGAEGMHWLGQAPFTTEKHVFVNLGDGTYFHSGTLAIRAAVAAGVNITYKILYNDAVAMTGGQPVDGVLTVPQIVTQLRAERVKRIVVVSDDIEKYKVPAPEMLPEGTEVRSRDDMDAVQKELREVPGCSAIVYDQTCAAEKRRRRKKIVDGKPLLIDPDQRLFINEAVCEGCGDCSVQSSCLSIEPLETPLGRKRKINQSSCNKDYSCVKGFCPSFVTVKGGKLRSATAAIGPIEIPAVPEPALPAIDGIFNILLTGVGGTGVVTIGQLLGMAAHLESKPASTLDITGVSQKGGAVLSHIRIGAPGTQMTAARVALGAADTIIGCDLVVTAGDEALSKASPGRTRVLVNSSLVPTAAFVTQRDWSYPAGSAEAAIQASVAADHASFIDAGAVATRLLGDAIYVNCFMLGFAWQRGWIPLSRAALLKAIEINGASVAKNHKAFEWGRYAAHDAPALRHLLAPEKVVSLQVTPGLASVVRQRMEHLTGYMNAAYAERYQRLVNRVEQAEQSACGSTRLAMAVAANYAKLLAYKDEYEVGRLYSGAAFRQRLQETFEGPYEIEFNLAPPLLSRRNSRGELIKRPYGSWMRHSFAALARLKFLRGTVFDIFGYTAERREERQLIARYEALIEEIITKLAPDRIDTAVAIAAVPNDIRGFGHVKHKSVQDADARWTDLLAVFRGETPDQTLAERKKQAQGTAFRMFG